MPPDAQVLKLAQWLSPASSVGAFARSHGLEAAVASGAVPDAEALTRMQVLPAERIRGVETGGCPHTAIREDASINLAAIADPTARFPDLEVILIEPGGDNLSATFSPERADPTVHAIDVAAGEEIPRKGGPAITKSDLPVINKTDLAPMSAPILR